MKKTVFAAILAAISMTAQAYQADCAVSYFDGKAPVITNAKLAQETTPLCFSEFAVMHSGISRTPLWSAERLTAERVREARTLERKDSFHAEPLLSRSERSELKDFVRSGYQRGHMSPNGDMTTVESQHESFSLANIVPQNPDNNMHLWAGIETAVRDLAVRRGELFVITGPLFSGGKLSQLNDRVLVPTRLFKLVYDPRAGKGAVYLANNADGSDYSVISIAELEEMSGISFITGMSERTKSAKLPLPAPDARGYGARHGNHEDQELRSIARSIHKFIR
ncbi:DNA/RNA non-specific endonuclease [Ralstonia pseudosolanacearum]|uniref:DNA/RNA non-specific endonuclease n=1 Tax=Ralstonia pseudosolanacearum TaxID=1310165 RepID=UPI003CFAE515